MTSPVFAPMEKIARFNRNVIVTEKIDGTNASIWISDELELSDGTKYHELKVGSRTKWLSPTEDNFGFHAWALEHREELFRLGPGHHFGEWWGQGIQRKYGLAERRFSLFNVHRWGDPEKRPACCHVVPTLWVGTMDHLDTDKILADLKEHGSMAAPGFMKPEGIVIYHPASKQLFKRTIEKDDKHKGEE